MGTIRKTPVNTTSLYQTMYEFEVPTFTSTTTWGTLTASSYVNSSNAIYYVLNGVYGTSSSSGWLGSSSSSTSEWWQWEFKTDLYVKNVRVYQTDKCATTSVQMYSLEGVQLSEDLELEQTTTSYVDITLDYPTLLSGFKLVVTGDGSSYCGIGEIEMEAYYEGDSVTSTEDETVTRNLQYINMVYDEGDDWEQPVFTANDTWGTVTAGSYLDDNYPWHALDGVLGGDDEDTVTSWIRSSSSSEWKWLFEEPLLISNIRIYQRSYSSGSYYTSSAAVYEYSGGTVLFSETSMEQEADAYIDFTFDTPQVLGGIYIKVWGKYVGIGEVVLTAKEVSFNTAVTSTEATEDTVESGVVDWDYISSITSETDDDGETVYSLATSEYDPETAVEKYAAKVYYKAKEWEQPVLSANGTLGEDDFAVYASSTSSQYCYYAFDDDYSTYWTSGKSDKTCEVYIAADVAIYNICITNCLSQSTSGLPTAAVVYGSNDGDDWTEITSLSEITNIAGNIWDMAIPQDFSNPIIYHYYKIEFTSSSSYVYLAKIKFSGKKYVKSTSSDYDYCTTKLFDPYDKFYTPAKYKNSVLKGYRSVKSSEPVYLNWCPWTQPMLTEAGVIYGLKSDNNYGAAYCCTSDSNAPGWFCFSRQKSISDTTYYGGESANSWSAEYSGNSSAHSGIVTYDDNPDYYHTLVFHSPAFITLSTITMGIHLIQKVQIYGSYDGTTLYSVGEYEFNDTQQEVDFYGNGVYVRDDFAQRYLTNRCGIYVPDTLQKAYKYIILRIFPVEKTSSGYYYQPTLTNVLFTGQILDDVAWTDNEMYDWEMPYLTGDITPTDYGNITISASSSGGLPAYQIFSEDYATDYDIGWCPYPAIENDSETGWYMIKFPYKIALTKLVHYEYNASWDSSCSGLTGQFYADELMETSIGDEFTTSEIGTGETTETVIFNDSENYIVTDTIFFYKKSGGIYSGISHLDIEGKRLPYTTADSTNAKYVVTSSSCLPANVEDDTDLWSNLLLALQIIAVIAELSLMVAAGQPEGVPLCALTPIP